MFVTSLCCPPWWHPSPSHIQPLSLHTAVHRSPLPLLPPSTQAEHGLIVAPGTKCFDLFSTWRLDSGVWEEQAELVVGAWEGRCEERQTRGLSPLPKPRLMHSNLSTVGGCTY